MSKWQNPSWQYPPPPPTGSGTWQNPIKQPELHAYAPTPQNRNPVYENPMPGTGAGPRELSSGNMGVGSPPKQSSEGPQVPMSPQARIDTTPTPAAEESVPRPMVQSHYPHMRPAYMGSAPLALGPNGQPIPMYINPMAPPDYSIYGNYHTHNEQWDQFGHAGKPPMPGGPVGLAEMPMMMPKYESNARESPQSSPSTDSASVKDSETTSETSSVPSASRVTRRSRMGCLTCRHRKKRCCETRPQCTECQRLRLKCVWPKPGTEHKNKPKEIKSQENMIDHDVYGKIKVLRGIVEYRSD